jgi:orotidine-5'-phosphate decarboxylase
VRSYKPIRLLRANGIKGWQSLQKTIEYLNENYPDIFTIADAKRGDIGNTSSMYAKTFLEDMNFDSVTVAPYMGKDCRTVSLRRKQTYHLTMRSLPTKALSISRPKVAGKPLYQQIIETSQTGRMPKPHVCSGRDQSRVFHGNPKTRAPQFFVGSGCWRTGR